MILTVKNSNISLSIHADNVQEQITFQVIPEGRKKLTIADKYVFGSQYPDKDKTDISEWLTSGFKAIDFSPLL